MSPFKKPFSYGSLQLPSNIFYAPLAGCSNLPFRQLSSRYAKPGLHYCEMVKMEGLWRGDRATLRLLDYTPCSHPIGAQLVGADIKLAAPCARLLEQMGFDAIDLNCGCPVDKVTRDGSGSALLRQPYLIGELLAEMSAAVSVPVSVKIRTGWDDDTRNAIEIAKIASSAGACALTLHGRTRAQGYRGKADWDYIARCKTSLEDQESFRLIGNGDLFSVEDAQAIFTRTHCDALMISRGVLGAPWIASDIETHLQGGIVRPRPLSFVLDVLEEHYDLACLYLGEEQAIVEMRKFSGWYLTSYGQAKLARSALAQAKSREEVASLLQDLRSRSTTQLDSDPSPQAIY